MTAKASRIPDAMRVRVGMRDPWCVLAGHWPHECGFGRQLDHVRASGGLGMKSVTCDCNLVSLCGRAHEYKTSHGREVRPILLDYLSRFDYDLEADHAHAG